MTLEIFAAFGVMFPSDFSFSMKGKITHAQKIWSKAIQNFTPEEIQRGISTCEDLLSMPNLGQFKNLCRPAKPKINPGAYQKLNARDFKLLTQFEPRTITGKAELRLCAVINQTLLVEYDDNTENKITEYYRTRPMDYYNHPEVIEFINTAKMSWHSPQ